MILFVNPGTPPQELVLRFFYLLAVSFIIYLVREIFKVPEIRDLVIFLFCILKSIVKIDSPSKGKKNGS